MFAVAPIDVAGNIDYKSLCYIITHGDEKEDWEKNTGKNSQDVVTTRVVHC